MTEDVRVYQIPLPTRKTLVISAEFPLTEEEWAFAMTILEVMKPGLVKSAPEVAAPKGQDPEE